MTLWSEHPTQKAHLRRLDDCHLASFHADEPVGPDETAFFQLSSELYCRLYRSSLVEVVNAAFQRVLGWSACEAIGHALRDRVHPDDRAALMNALSKVDEGGGPLVLAARMQRRGGGFVPVEWRVARWGESICLLGTDQRHRAALDKQLSDARKEADASQRAKSAFFEIISHEMRTPLNPIVGFSDLLLASPLIPEQREAVENVRRSAAHLTQVLGDIIEFSRTEAEGFSCINEPFLLSDLLACTYEVHAGAAVAKGLAWSVDSSGLEEALFLGDHRMLRKALFKLVDNAVKFTEHGDVLVRVRRVAVEGAVNRLRFEVSDSGPGIPEAFSSRLFDPFFQGDSGEIRNSAGTGMGLAIAAKAVESLGGRIGVQSQPDVGSLFWFEVEMPEVERPLEDTWRRTPALPAMAGSDRKRVLLHMADAAARTRLEQVLTRMGHWVERAEGTAQAISRLSDRPLDVVFVAVDAAAPQELATLRRARTAPASGMPKLVALSTEASLDARQRCLNSGADFFVTQPVRLPELRGLFRKLRES